MKKLTGYELMRQWLDWSYENQDKVKCHHHALMFVVIDLWNRLGQMDRFGLPTEITMKQSKIGAYKTFKKCLDDFIEWGFVEEICSSRNQHNSRVISLLRKEKNNQKSLDKALLNVAIAEEVALDNIPKQVQSTSEAHTKADAKQVQSTSTIDKLQTTNLKLQTTNTTVGDAVASVAENNLRIESINPQKPFEAKKEKSSGKKEKKPETIIHNRCRSFYEEHCKENSIECYWTGTYARGLKELNQKIKHSFTEKIGRDPTEDEAVSWFSVLIKNLPEFFKNKNLKVISEHYGTIVTEIRKSTGKARQQINDSSEAKSMLRTIAEDKLREREQVRPTG